MARHIGIVGGSAEGAALCYRTICTEAEKTMGEHNHPEVSLHTFPLASYMTHIVDDDWLGVGELMAQSAVKLAEIGADFAICPDNTFHQAFEYAAEQSPIPWLHIAEAVANEAVGQKRKRLGITGTAYLMAGPVYPAVLEQCGIDYVLPAEGARAEINRIIFDELVKGVFNDEARETFNDIFASLREEGCDAVVMGCTEIPILMDGVATPLPVLDSTRILARAALARALT